MAKSKPYNIFETFLIRSGVVRDEIMAALGVKESDSTKYRDIIRNPYMLLSLRDIDALSIITKYPFAHIRKMAMIGSKKLKDMSDDEFDIYMRTSKNAPISLRKIKEWRNTTTA